MKHIYLDYNATTPIDSSVQESVAKSLNDDWANPSSTSLFGRKAKEAIETARQEIGLAISADPSDIIFTSGGTEASNMAIYSAVKFSIDNGCSSPHVITSNVEHVATSNTLKEFQKSLNICITEVAVDKRGMLSMDDIVSAVTYKTCLITIMLANNETGVIFPIAEISSALSKLNKERQGLSLPIILLHSDAAQAIGKINVDVKELGVDYLTIAGHKFYGPRIGALYVHSLGKKNVAFPILQGGGQERGYRPGTENTAMIVGLGKAALLVHQNLKKYRSQMETTRDYLEEKLNEAWDGVVVNCCEAPRLPNTTNVSFKGLQCSGALLLEACNCTIASTTAACHSQDEPSNVLIASGVQRELAITAIRFSTGRDTTESDINIVVTDLKEAIKKIHKNKQKI